MVLSTLRIYVFHAYCFKQSGMNNMPVGLEMQTTGDFSVVGYLQYSVLQVILLGSVVIFCPTHNRNNTQITFVCLFFLDVSLQMLTI